jgi:hypothetical protein
VTGRWPAQTAPDRFLPEACRSADRRLDWRELIREESTRLLVSPSRPTACQQIRNRGGLSLGSARDMAALKLSGEIPVSSGRPRSASTLR